MFKQRYIQGLFEIIQKKSLRRTIISNMVIIGLLPLILGILLVYIGSTRIIRNSIGANFKEIAKETADKIDIMIYNTIDEIRNLGISPDIRNAVKRSNQEQQMTMDIQASMHLKSLMSYEKDKYVALYVTDSKNIMVAATDSEYDFYNENIEQWKNVSNTEINKIYLKDIFLNEKDNNPLMGILIPVVEDGRAIGTIKAILRTDFLNRAILDVKIDKTGHANLVDSEGTIIICPIFPPRSHSINPPLMKLIVADTPGWSVAEDDAHGGKNSIIGFAPAKITFDPSIHFGDKRWYIFVRQHPDETYSPMSRLLIIVLLSGILVVAILSTLGIYASNRIGKPILLLKEGAEIIGKGNFEYRLNIDTGDEIASLSREFNSMAEKLTGLYNQLTEERNTLESILLSVGDGIIVADDKDRVIMINPAVEEIMGVDKKQIIGKSIFPCHGNPDKVEEFIKQPDKISSSSTSTVGGKTVEIVATLIKTENKTVGSVMTMRDVTINKKMEKELKEYSEHLEKMINERTKEIKDTKDYLQNLLENANDVIFTIQKDGKFTYLNQKIEDWGYKKDELLGQSILNIMTNQHEGKRFIKSINKGEKKIYEIDLLNKRGDTRNVVISLSPVSSGNGDITNILAIAMDITDRKRIQSQMNKTEKLAAIGQLVTGIAHEINNPLGGMQNCVRTLYAEGYEESVRRRYLPLLEKGLSRIDSVIRNLLDFAKEPQFNFSAHNLDEIILETLKLVEYKMNENSIDLKLDLNAGNLHYILDPNRLQQVFLNIIINAIQAMPLGGTLSVKSEADGDCLIIAISDTGMGISEENLSKIFDPFFTTKDVGTGTGLGLSVSYSIIKGLDGRIEVQSEVNKGTLFTLVIPKKIAHEIKVHN